jgi:hypothetical protein
MTIQIDTVELAKDLIVEDEFNWTGVESVVDMSVGGVPIIWESEKTGQPMDLVGGEKFGWLLRGVLKDVHALACVPRATYTLILGGESMTVRFRHEDEPVIEAEPMQPTPDVEDTDRYKNVRIKLMILG